MKYEEVEQILGVTFSDKALLDAAFTHRSYAATHDAPSYDRLEFLGDGVLDSIVCAYLFDLDGGDEGRLTALKCRIVCADSLYRAAKSIHLERFVRVSAQVATDGLFTWPLDDVYEAVVGAIYLDRGYEETKRFVERTLLRDRREFALKSYKSLLQERMQRLYKENVVGYETERDDMKKGGIAGRFVSRVMICGKTVARGSGRNKRAAETQAAKRYLEGLLGPEI